MRPEMTPLGELAPACRTDVRPLVGVNSFMHVKVSFRGKGLGTKSATEGSNVGVDGQEVRVQTAGTSESLVTQVARLRALAVDPWGFGNSNW